MNLRRFIWKCLTNRPAAVQSAKLVIRSFYGRLYWSFYPGKLLAYSLPTGGTLLLEPTHSFTACFWPGVDQYEPDVRETLKYLLKPGDVFIDCGANIGYFSVLAGGLVGKQGKVISIEANPITYNLLKQNLNQNSWDIPIHCALGSKSGEVELFVPLKGDIYSSLKKGGLIDGDSVSTFRVQGRKLDDVIDELALLKIDVVKIDIEGGELDVLNSAHNLLSIFRPIVIMEYGTNTWPSFGATPANLQALTSKYRYCISSYDLAKRKLTAVGEDVWQQPYANL